MKQKAKSLKFKNVFPILFSFSLFFVATVLLFLKIIWGYNYLLESIMLYGISISVYYSYISTFKLNETIMILSDLIDYFSKRLKQDAKTLDKTIEITNLSSKEEIEKVKKDFPAISNIIDGFFAFGGTNKKEYSEMNKKELENELEIAKENDDFETASLIRNYIEKLNG
jgi:hypothetical protein